MSKIEWTDITWNPVWGCQYSCGYCYARSIAKRFAKPIAEKEASYSKTNRIILETSLFSFAPTWLESQFDKKLPKKASVVFVGSMTDIADWDNDWIMRVFDKIRMHPQHVFLFLTKRPEELLDLIWPSNSWIGISAENQALFDKRAYWVKRLRTENLFLSAEPMMGPISIVGFDHSWIKWVIVGGMSGAKAKAVNKEWAINLRNACNFFDIPFFFKQWGGRGVESMKKPLVRQFPVEFNKVI